MFDLERCIVPRKETNYSIKLAPVADYPFHNNKCECSMCKEYETVAYLLIDLACRRCCKIIANK